MRHPAQFVAKSRSLHVPETLYRSFSERRRRMWRIRPILGLGHLRYIYSTQSIFLARVELVEMLEKAYIHWRSEFGGFSTHVIPVASLHRASTDALIETCVARYIRFHLINFR